MADHPSAAAILDNPMNTASGDQPKDELHRRFDDRKTEGFDTFRHEIGGISTLAGAFSPSEANFWKPGCAL
jgi:hypothetical protein